MRFHFSEKGIITFAVIVACTALLFSGRDHAVGYTLIAVVAGYFGLELGPVQWIAKRKEKK